MKVDLGIWDRLSRLIVVLLVLAGLVGVVYSYVPGVRRNEALRRQIHQKQTEVNAELQRSNVLRAEIESFRDARQLEQHARQRLNVARSNEIVFRFVAPPSNAAPRRSP